MTATAACGHKDDEQADPFRIFLLPPEGAMKRHQASFETRV